MPETSTVTEVRGRNRSEGNHELPDMPAGSTLVVTPTGFYVKQMDGSWDRWDDHDLNTIADANGQASGVKTEDSIDSGGETPTRAMDASGAWRTIGDAPQRELETLAQHDYQHSAGVRKPKTELVVPYHCVPLDHALAGGGIAFPNELAFAQDADIGQKLSICIGPQEIQPPLKRGFFTNQYRVRHGVKNVPVTRGELARLVATALRELMDLHTLRHKGTPIDFAQLGLVEVRMRSKATLQAVFAVLLPADRNG